MRKSLENNATEQDKETNRIDFICQRLEEKLMKKKELDDARQSVKFMQYRLRGSEL